VPYARSLWRCFLRRMVSQESQTIVQSSTGVVVPDIVRVASSPRGMRGSRFSLSPPPPNLFFEATPTRQFFRHIFALWRYEGAMPAAEKDVRSVGDHSCQICFEHDQSTAMLPCGHGGLCWDCGLQIYALTEECPMCRTKIELVSAMDANLANLSGVNQAPSISPALWTSCIEVFHQFAWSSTPQYLPFRSTGSACPPRR